MSVLTYIKARRIEEILITATEHVNGFTDAIHTVFPEYKTRICIVHQIRSVCRYVVWKFGRIKSMTTDLQAISNVPNRQTAELALEYLRVKGSLNFPMKSIYLVVRETSIKWPMFIRSWGVILNLFFILYKQRVRI